MADSEALRARRYRAHRAGSHELCRHPGLEIAADPPAFDDAGEIGDPVAALEQLAGRLAGAYAANRGNVMLARELRLTLVDLVKLKPPDEDFDAALKDLFGDTMPG
jgi:hypothetical protein